MIRKIDHLVITTGQIEACLNFYRALGFMVRDSGGRYELFAGDFKINVHLLGQELSPKAGRVQPGSADLCFETGLSIDMLEKELQKKGLVFELGPVQRRGVRGVMQSIYLRDPDQNLIELCCYGCKLT